MFHVLLMACISDFDGNAAGFAAKRIADRNVFMADLFKVKFQNLHKRFQLCIREHFGWKTDFHAVFIHVDAEFVALTSRQGHGNAELHFSPLARTVFQVGIRINQLGKFVDDRLVMLHGMLPVLSDYAHDGHPARPESPDLGR